MLNAKQQKGNITETKQDFNCQQRNTIWEEIVGSIQHGGNFYQGWIKFANMH